MSTYRGISFPFRKGDSSLPEAAEDVRLVQDSIIQILMTSKGERYSRPNFGAYVHRYVFENNNEALEALIQSEVVSAISTYEPRVFVQRVSFVREESTITVTIDYVLKLTRETKRLEVELPVNGS